MTEFSPATRAAIYQAGDGRCIGCGRVDITAQHRRRRGMGGTKDPLIGTPANGLPLCGSGTTGCHGWTERHPVEAKLLGWALDVYEDQLAAPFWTRHGWRRWTAEPAIVSTPSGSIHTIPPFYAVAYVDLDELDRHEARDQAITTYNRRAPGWR